MPQRRGTLPISDPDVVYCHDTYARGVPYDSLARLRAKTPVVWVEETAAGGPGCWVVLRHADARHVLTRPELFSPQLDDTWLHDPASRPYDPALPAPDACMIDMDPQAHAMLDRLAGLDPGGPGGPADFATDVAGDLPEMLRNAVSGGVYALLRHPGQYLRLRSEQGDGRLLGQAVEEMLRWWSPVMHVRRTVQRGTVLGGVPIRPGEQVAVWLASANHDEEVFNSPGRFDITRQHNPHLAFGEGSRRCLGTELARTHMRAVVAALLERPGLLELAGEPVRLRSNARNGFKRLPVRWLG